MMAVGLGTWQAACYSTSVLSTRQVHSCHALQSNDGDAAAAVSHALRSGQRHLDLADRYGNQAEIGVALEQIFQEGKVKREEVQHNSHLTHTLSFVCRPCRMT